MEFSQLKQEVCLQFILKIIIYEELFEKSLIIFTCGDILKLYNKLDETVVENDENKEILKLCDNAATFDTNLRDVEKIVCKKLLNNLLQLKNDKYDDDFKKLCSNLYVWLYFKINKPRISNDIIKKIFELPNSTEYIQRKYNYCPYFSFNDKIRNPESIMKLRIFNDNSDTFQSMLKDRNKLKDCDLRKYVYECIKIYQEMNRTYILSGDCSSSQHKNACDIINEFKQLYSSFIYNRNEILHKFPELSSYTSTNIIDGCPSPENTADSTSGEPSQTGTSTRGVVSPALGVMAGIPPFLALIYNVNIIFTKIS
ncbi:hypothetical protein PVNG_02215 [Plasmodium vivax North Korean]|uniref:Uncharacterized protein n=1 Tax=Plasmodium vivax North Korean TaxID=1035514 RepID=A0A0J9TWY6_PLAVI|nr:hypothetical protein PVNG_02215 [Plasmodium vivax North Korean]